jgi:hypothetical protein
LTDPAGRQKLPGWGKRIELTLSGNKGERRLREDRKRIHNINNY